MTETSEQPTNENRMDAALNYLKNEEQSTVQEQPEPEVQEQQEVQEQPKEDKGEYYAKLVEKDREITKLKNQLKNKSPDLKELVKEDPKKVISELGLSLDQVIDLLVGGDEQQEPQVQEPQTNDELAELKQEIERIKEEKKQQQYQMAYDNEIGKIKKIVETDDKWEFVKTTNNFALVLETAAEMYKADPENPPEYNVVLDAVESYLEDHFGQMYEQLSKVSKLKSKFVKEEPQLENEENRNKGLGHTLPTSQSSDTPTPRSFSEQERINRALQVLENSGD